MDRSGQIETNRSVLMRIVALLLALADLAERAAGASRPVRYQVLWALRQADEVVSEFVTGSTCEGGQWPSASMPACCGFDPADAENLAASLRMLAFMVQAMAARTSRSFSHCGARRAGEARDSSGRQSSRARRKRGRLRDVGWNAACLERRPRAPPRPPPRLARNASPSLRKKQ
jgi:hypothetical protein